MNLLVTTGATVTFKELISFVVTDQFIELAAGNGITRLCIQYGNEITNGINTSQQFINECLKSTNEFNSFILSSKESQVYQHKDMCMEFFPFSSNLALYIDSADVIISHGGTGTLIDILNHNKRLIVVYNENLMGNHQYEVANELEKMEYCVVFSSSGLQFDTFAARFKDLISGSLKLAEYHGGDGKVVQSIVYQELTNSIS